MNIGKITRPEAKEKQTISKIQHWKYKIKESMTKNIQRDKREAQKWVVEK